MSGSPDGEGSSAGELSQFSFLGRAGAGGSRVRDVVQRGGGGAPLPALVRHRRGLGVDRARALGADGLSFSVRRQFRI